MRFGPKPPLQLANDCRTNTQGAQDNHLLPLKPDHGPAPTPTQISLAQLCPDAHLQDGSCRHEQLLDGVQPTVPARKPLQLLPPSPRKETSKPGFSLNGAMNPGTGRSSQSHHRLTSVPTLQVPSDTQPEPAGIPSPSAP